MSLTRKLNPKHRERAKDRVHMMRVMRARFYADQRAPLAQLYLATHIALERLRQDPARAGDAKDRIYKQILDEYTLNMAKAR